MSLFVVQDLERNIEGRCLFRALGFALERGQTLAIQAPSGAGKTLLLRMLAWLDPVEKGTLNLDHRSPWQWGATRWRSEVVYCPQRPPLLPGSPADFAQEMAGFAAQSDRPRDDPFELAKDWGVAEVWEREWSTLSGGETQRAALAIAVASRPSVLLLDEPTAALDDTVRDVIESQLAGHTAIWVTHDKAQARRVADQHLLLADFAPEGGA